MRRPVIAILLCICAAAASAQCATQAAAAGRTRAGAELIKIGATTREQTLPADDGLPSVHEQATAAKSTDKPQPRRAGAAMLLAAVALMSGIALRRFSAHMR
jgi:hypothetical protein